MSEAGLTATPGAETLSRSAIARVDPSDQLGDVLAMPEHLRDAVWRVESAIMEDWDTSAGLVVATVRQSEPLSAVRRSSPATSSPRCIPTTRPFMT